MYNEDQLLFLKTWNALQRNIQYLCQKKNSKVWGHEGWRKIVICVISDGRLKIHRKTLAVLGLLGLFQEGLITTSLDGMPVSGHLFEYSTHVCLDENYIAERKDNDVVPTQTIFFLKENNAKKINSHRWFFNAFGALLLPKVCILIDVGTVPSNKSLYYLWRGKND
jgi:chitin synthase